MATMAKMTSGLAAALLIGSAVHAEQTVTRKTDPITATVTIQSIDKANRLITIKDESGAEDMMLVGPEMKRFDELKVGDKVKISYQESLVFQVKKPGDPTTTAGDTAKLTPGTGGVAIRHFVEAADDLSRGPGHRPEAALDHGQNSGRPDRDAQGRQPQEPRGRQSRRQDRDYVHAGRSPERRPDQVTLRPRLVVFIDACADRLTLGSLVGAPAGGRRCYRLTRLPAC